MNKLKFNLAIVSLLALFLTGCTADKPTPATTTKGAAETANVSAQLTDE